MKTKVIIAEKRNIGISIAEALDNGEDIHESHRDILEVRTKLEHDKRKCDVFKENRKKKEYFYFCQKSCDNCRFHAKYTDEKNDIKARNTRKNLERILNNHEDEKAAIEDIQFSVIEKPEENIRYIILDTSGNMMNLKNNSKTYLEKAIKNSNSFSSLEDKIGLLPEIEERKSYLGRSFLINSVLAHERMPCDTEHRKKGDKIYIDEVIGATDFDIAGSYIYQSIIDSANLFREKKGKKPLSKIKRIKIDNLDAESIKKQIEKPMERDWENIYSGKLKSMIDFIYGTTLTHQLNHFMKRRHPDGPKISIGRNVYLGLKELIKEDIISQMARPEKKTYIIFNKAESKKEIMDSFNQENYTIVSTEEYVKGVSYTDLLEACKNAKIGTHTTRYTLPEQLEESDVAILEDDIIKPTEYGKAYLAIMDEYIDNENNEFNITGLNQVLNIALEKWRTDKNYSNRIEGNEETRKSIANKRYMNFMEAFFVHFKEHLKNIGREYNEITDKLYTAHKNLKEELKPKQYKNESGKNSIEGIFKGLKGTVSEDFIDKIITKDNKVRDKNKIIKRQISKEPRKESIDKEKIRRSCLISRSKDFRVTYHRNIENLVKWNENSMRIYSCEDEFPEMLSDIEEKETYGKELIYTSQYEGTHGPLFVDKYDPKLLDTIDNRRLAMEYNNPWEFNERIEESIDSNFQIIKSFKMSNKEFTRETYYEEGKVHNFESILKIMFEKYGYSFKNTANIAEELYLKASRCK